MWGNRTVTQMLTTASTRTNKSLISFVSASETSQLFSSTSFVAPYPCAPRRRGGALEVVVPHTPRAPHEGPLSIEVIVAYLQEDRMLSFFCLMCFLFFVLILIVMVIGVSRIVIVRYT